MFLAEGFGTSLADLSSKLITVAATVAMLTTVSGSRRLEAATNPAWQPIQIPLRASEAGVLRSTHYLSRIVSGGNAVRILSDSNVILTSSDQGRSWSAVQQDDPALQVTSAVFRDERVGWETGSANREPFLAATFDAGTSWRRMLTLPGTNNSVLMDVRFLGKAGVAVGGSQFQSIIAVTRDGGHSWKVNSIDTDDQDPVLRRVCFRSPSEIWAVGSRSIYVSEDKGSTWTLNHIEPGA
jgi:photosystem II stability/assembly factor-like uncharacterized protein